MSKWRLLAIFAYFVPIMLFVSTKLFTRWEYDIENCIFAFFVGILIQFLIGIFGLIGIRKEENMNKERMLFRISIVPLFLVTAMFLIYSCY